MLHPPTTKEGFEEYVKGLFARDDYVRPAAFGIGIASADKEGKMYEVRYFAQNFGHSFGSAAAIAYELGWNGQSGTLEVTRAQLESILGVFVAYEQDPLEQHPNIKALVNLRSAMETPLVNDRRRFVVTFITDIEADPVDLMDVYLRFHIVSSRQAKPKAINVKGAFGLLRNIAWTNRGPLPIEELPEHLDQARITGDWLHVFSVDKFPAMFNYVCPGMVRVVNAQNVRLGAYLGAGTTLMTAGAVNFNAGTEGPNMIEGRISGDCWMDAHSDLGGGASLMGTLSGGGTERVTVGKNCLIGANGGTGIALGDDCKVEAGLYVTKNTLVTLVDSDKNDIRTVKALELQGESGLTFFRDATGRVIAGPTKNAAALNPILHANQ